MERFGLILISFFLLGADSLAQIRISGVIMDVSDGNLLIGAHIIEMSKPSNGTISDVTGSFELIVAPGSSIKIGFLGYRDTLIQCASDCQLRVALVSESAVLEQFVVTASRGRESLRNLTISMESVKPYIAQNKNIVSLDKLAEQIPGVQIVDNQANIRAGSGWTYGAGSRVLVLVDGMPMMSGDAGQVLWNFLPIDNLANTEVIKGAASVLYGSSALNGIINIRTARPSDKPYSSVSSYAGMYAKASRKGLEWYSNRPVFYGINAAHARKWKRNELSLALNHNTDDGYRMGTPDNRKRFGLRYRYILNDKLHLGLNSAAMTNESGSFLLWQNLDSGYTAFNREVTITRSTRFHIDPWLEYNGKRHAHALRMRYLLIDNQIDNGDPNNDQSNASDYVYGEYQWNRKAERNGLNLSAGLTAGWVESRSPLYMGNQQAGNTAVFAQADQKWRKWKWNAGARWERYYLNDSNESRPVFRGGLNYELHKSGFLRASWGQGYRFPTIAEQYISTTVGPMTIYPNSELRSESGWNAELGYKQAFKIGSFRGYADLSVFRMEYKNMIEFNFNQWQMPSISDFGIGFKALNVGPARVDGTELSIMGEGSVFGGTVSVLSGIMLSRPLALDPSYEFGQSIFGDPINFENSSSNPEENILKYRSRNQVRSDFQYERNSWSGGLSYRYNSAIENIDLAFVSAPLDLFIPDIAAGRKTSEKGMHFFDVRVQYAFRLKSRSNQMQTLNLGLLANNLFNRIYMLRPADLQAPRSIQVTLKYEIR